MTARLPVMLVLTVLLLALGPGCDGSGVGMALPPQGDAASEALRDSHRHGEWVDVPLQGTDTPVRAWAKACFRQSRGNGEVG